MSEKEYNKELVIQNLKDAGLNDDMVREYLQYKEAGMTKQQICLLCKKRLMLLEKIHDYQKTLDTLDYLLFYLKNRKGEENESNNI